jgi:hypothetical protein
MHSSVRQRGVDYTPFRDLLAAGEWEKADDEHRRLVRSISHWFPYDRVRVVNADP